MKRIVWIINLFYYSIYRLDYNLHLIFNRIDPTLLLLKTPFIKKQSKRSNIKDPVAHLNKIFENPAYGISQTRAFGLVGLHLIVLITSLVMLAITIFDIGHNLVNTEAMICISLLAAFILYITTLKKKKYLEYFRKFNKNSKSEKRKHSFLAIIISVSVFIFAYIAVCYYGSYERFEL